MSDSENTTNEEIDKLQSLIETYSQQYRDTSTAMSSLILRVLDVEDRLEKIEKRLK